MPHALLHQYACLPLLADKRKSDKGYIRYAVRSDKAKFICTFPPLARFRSPHVCSLQVNLAVVHLPVSCACSSSLPADLQASGILGVVGVSTQLSLLTSRSLLLSALLISALPLGAKLRRNRTFYPSQAGSDRPYGSFPSPLAHPACPLLLRLTR